MQREDLYRQTRAALGSTAGQDSPAVFRAHAFAEPVFSLLLEVRRLLKRKRHTGHPFEQNAQANSIERRIIGRPPRPVKPTAGRARIAVLTVMLTRASPHSLLIHVQHVQIGALLWTFHEKWTRLPQILRLDMRTHHDNLLQNQGLANRRLEDVLAPPLRSYESSDSPAPRTHSAMRIELFINLEGASI